MVQAALDVASDTEDMSTGISDEARKTTSEALSNVLTDTYSLIIKTHIYHWNVAGPMFHAIHEMTEEQYTNLFQAADDIAERIRALGHKAPLSSAGHANSAKIEVTAEAKTAHAMVSDLIETHEAAIRRMRKAAVAAEEGNDFVSHDLLVGRMTYHEKILWMWRALITE